MLNSDQTGDPSRELNPKRLTSGTQKEEKPSCAHAAGLCPTLSSHESPRQLRAAGTMPPYPLLVDVSEEDAVFLVLLLLQGVMPVLGLHQAARERERP